MKRVNNNSLFRVHNSDCVLEIIGYNFNPNHQEGKGGGVASDLLKVSY